MPISNQLNAGIVPFEKEELTDEQRLNEYIMTSLRTAEGLDLSIAASPKITIRNQLLKNILIPD